MVSPFFSPCFSPFSLHKRDGEREILEADSETASGEMRTQQTPGLDSETSSEECWAINIPRLDNEEAPEDFGAEDRS
jgi:hypothetical protein